ncbi:uncharacterized protein KY384_006692 [Bacidia gigantensis]|uniref:uncharacterized protein n=1 Tax=Bacidia gigantensis TaxID=2732470 RepID=UPI001D03C2F3|nr:uncharacterized protein KY384_006692 [Bacidia gigantensis]KAG8529003.1 hypothetical protein KY384_006692 [Bacidia gigantensis]
MDGDSLRDEIFPPSQIATQYTDYVNKPLILLPSPLTDVDPAWKTCAMGDTNLGVYDPPRAIVPTSAMVATAAMTDAAEPSKPMQLVPQPASVISDAAPTQTSIVAALSNGDNIVGISGSKSGGQKPDPQQGSNAQDQQSNTSGEFDTLPNKNQNEPDDVDNRSNNNPDTPSATNSQISDQSAGNGKPSSSKGTETEVSSQSNGAGSTDTNDKSHSDPQKELGSNNQDYSVADHIAFGISGMYPSPKSDQPANDQPTPNKNEESSADKGEAPSLNKNNHPSDVPAKAQAQGHAIPSIIVGGHTVQPAASQGLAVDGVHLNPATPVTTASNVQISVGAAGVVLGGNTIAVPSHDSTVAAPNIAIGTHHINIIPNAAAGHQLVIDSSTLPAGASQATVGNHIVSLVNGAQLSVLPTTLPYIPLANTNSPSTTSPIVFPAVGLITPQALPNSAISLAGTTLSAGGPAATASGTPISVLPSNAGLVIGSQTVHPQPIPTPPPQLGLVLNGTTLTPLSGSKVVVAGSTLSQNGQTVALGNGEICTLRNGSVGVGDETYPLPVVVATASTPASSVESKIQSLANGDVVYQGKTLEKGGPAVTLAGGEVVSLEGSGKSVSVSSTSVASSSAATSPASGTTAAPTTNASTSSTSQKSAATTSDTGVLGMGAVHDSGSGSGRSLIVELELLMIMIGAAVWSLV